MSLYGRNMIQDAKIVSQKKRLPNNAYPKELASEIKKVNNMNFTGEIIDTNKYMVRVGVVGICVGIGLAMYHKQSIWGGAILGGVLGGFAGKVVGSYFLRNRIK